MNAASQRGRSRASGLTRSLGAENYRSSAGNGRPGGGALTRMRASSTTAPSGPAQSGLQSSSAISGCAAASAETRRSTSSTAVTSAGGAPRYPSSSGNVRKRAQHGARGARTQRGEPDGGVAQELDGVTARTARDHRAEVRVPDDPDDQLDARGGHPLHQEAFDVVTRGVHGARHRRGRRAPRRLLPPTSSATAPASALCTSPGAIALMATGPPSAAAVRPASAGLLAMRDSINGTPYA